MIISSTKIHGAEQPNALQFGYSFESISTSQIVKMMNRSGFSIDIGNVKEAYTGNKNYSIYRIDSPQTCREGECLHLLLDLEGDIHPIFAHDVVGFFRLNSGRLVFHGRCKDQAITISNGKIVFSHQVKTCGDK